MFTCQPDLRIQVLREDISDWLLQIAYEKKIVAQYKESLEEYCECCADALNKLKSEYGIEVDLSKKIVDKSIVRTETIRFLVDCVERGLDAMDENGYFKRQIMMSNERIEILKANVDRNERMIRKILKENN